MSYTDHSAQRRFKTNTPNVKWIRREESEYKEGFKEEEEEEGRSEYKVK